MTNLTAKINGCFSEIWQDTQPLPGWVINQQPNKWTLSFVDPGDSLFGADDKATGYAECVHKLNRQLPPNEQMGGKDALILCHHEETAAHEPAVYKIFSQGGGFGVELKQTVIGLKPGSTAVVTAHIWCDVPNSTDPYAAEWQMYTQGKGRWWQYIKDMYSRTYKERIHAREVDENGELEIVFRFKAKYQIPSNFFIDAIYLDAELADETPGPGPEPTPCDCDELQAQIDTINQMLANVELVLNNHEVRLDKLEDATTPPPPQGIEIEDIVLSLKQHPTKEYSDRPIENIMALVIHHSAVSSSVDAYAIARYHVDTNDWPGIGYHYVIEADGSIQQTNYLATMSYHVGAENGTTVGICLLGDFTSAWPTQAQLDSAKALTRYLIDNQLAAEMIEIIPHREISQTACPGATWQKWFPLITGEIQPPPTGKTYPVDFLRADPQAWRVVRRADGSGEDVWDLPTIDGFVRVKNTSQGEWYSPTGKLRYLDTSPANDSQGNERLYKLFTDGEQGGRIAPDVAEVGKVYSYPVTVQFYRKGNCQPSPENSGEAVSTFQLVEVRDNYTLSTGVTVDRLFVTIQTGETQLYAIKDGRKIGWVGGGASQDNNIWFGELSEIYFDRQIPQTEPNRYCS